MTDPADPGPQHDEDADERNDRNLKELDDEQDREELRTRYYGLLQELRVILPGVQVLLAFLLTVPFANRFPELDDAGRTLFGVALVGAWCAVVCLLTPAVFHRVSDRQARRARLRWAIRTTLGGLVLLAASLLAALLCVLRLVFGTPVAVLLVAPVTLVLIGLWVVAPLRIRLESHR
ncbi:MAG: DUF6328 family protein [Acidimicrobiales bacterium]|nr:DUF6328 family protein [Acidimicrobiales bacterium]